MTGCSARSSAPDNRTGRRAIRVRLPSPGAGKAGAVRNIGKYPSRGGVDLYVFVCGVPVRVVSLLYVTLSVQYAGCRGEAECPLVCP
jgi:hypothetical protein